MELLCKIIDDIQNEVWEDQAMKEFDYSNKLMEMPQDEFRAMCQRMIDLERKTFDRFSLVFRRRLLSWWL
jgi:hypothetical protein